LADRDLVGQAVPAVDETDADADAARDDTAGVALDDAGDDGDDDDGDEAVGDAAVDAVADEASVVWVAGGEAEDDAPEVHPAALIPTTAATAAAAATAARRLVDLAEPNIADLFPRPRRRSFPRPGAAVKRDTESHCLYAF
jgi:hypothetical protein